MRTALLPRRWLAPFLLAAAFIAGLPAAGQSQSQGLVTLSAGVRGATGPQSERVRAGPLLGIDVRPIRWGWGALGLEASVAPRRAQRDSGAYFPPGQGCFGPDGLLTTCASIRQIRGETTLQLGVIASFGPTRPRTAPYGELGFGYYGIRPNNQTDIWDPSGRLLSNLSGADKSARGGVYARLGAGVRMKPWSRGPGLTLGARYRWARLGGFDDWSEWFNKRSGLEFVLGVRF